VFTKKSNSSWLMISSAMLGGFLLGVTYKKYGKNLSYHLHNMKDNEMSFNNNIPNETEI